MNLLEPGGAGRVQPRHSAREDDGGGGAGRLDAVPGQCHGQLDQLGDPAWPVSGSQRGGNVKGRTRGLGECVGRAKVGRHSRAIATDRLILKRNGGQHDLPASLKVERDAI
jgi:hypothetical protein